MPDRLVRRLKWIRDALDPRDDRYDSGFTVVELLVALALMAVAILLMSQALRLSTLGFLRVSRRAKEADSVLFAEVRLRQELERLSAEPYIVQGSAYTYLRGNEHSIEFGKEDEAGGIPVIKRVCIEMSPDGDLIESENDATEAADSSERQVVLLKSIQGVRFSYLAPTIRQGGAVWGDVWSFSKRAPQVVRIEVRFQPEDKRTWPLLLIHPRASVSRLCRYDMSSDRCQDY